MTTWTPVVLDDDEPNNVAWEPWQPKIGDRVRVRLSGECAAPWATLPLSSRLARAHVDGHLPPEDGQTGTVAQCRRGRGAFPCRHTATIGHPYAVDYDQPLLLDIPGFVDWRPTGGHYAVIELEPLDPQP